MPIGGMAVRTTVILSVGMMLSIGSSAARSDEMNAIFQLDSLTAGPGTSVRVPFRVLPDRDVSMLACSIDFDEEVLQVTQLEPVFERPDGKPWSVWINNFDNQNSTPGNGGVDEGWIHIVVVLAFDTVYPVVLPAGTETELFAIHFKVKEGTPAGITEVRFQDGANELGKNLVFAPEDGSGSEPLWEPASVLVGSLLKLVPGSTFQRGDATGDGATNISDPLAVLDYLFTGERAMACVDAADANDDGQLNMSDPISILSFLFLGEKEIPKPHPDCGADPTEDDLGCEAYRGC